jgi:peroxin-2
MTGKFLSRDIMSLSWQQAWDLAQPRLQAIRQSLPTFPHVTPRVLRVGQLDAELLDQELLQILTDPLAKAIGLVQVCKLVIRLSNRI